MDNKIRTDVCIIGGGIVGSFLASELAEKGLEVAVIEVPLNSVPVNIVSNGIKIDQSVNNYGLGGNESTWSQLTSFLNKDEWSFYKKKFNLRMSYSEFEELAKKVQPYGFCDFKFLVQRPKIDPNSMVKLKKFVKRKSGYKYSHLLKNRKNIKIYYSKILNINEGNKTITIKTSKEKCKIYFDFLCLCSGGIGNYHLVKRFLPGFLIQNKRHKINLHVKDFIGIYSFKNKSLSMKLGWKRANGVDYYFGIYKKPSEKDDFFSEDLYQFIPIRWYENVGFVRIKNVFWHKSLLETFNFLKEKIQSQGLVILFGANSTLFIKSLISSIPSILLHFLIKIFRIDPTYNKFLLLYHASISSNIEYDELKNSVKINSTNPIIYKNTINKNLEELNVKCVKSFKNIDLQDSNHFCSSTYENIAYPKKNRLDGQIDLNGFFFAAGTSSLPFASNTNPTFLSLCLAKKTVERICSDINKKKV